MGLMGLNFRIISYEEAVDASGVVKVFFYPLFIFLVPFLTINHIDMLIKYGTKHGTKHGTKWEPKKI